jgi:HlyD family secretion protein
VVVIHRADDLWVKVFVPATDLGRVRVDQAVEVTVDSHPERRFRGAVVQVAAASEFTPRNVQSVDERRHQVFAVKIRVADPHGVFKCGMAAEVFVLPAEGL